MILKYQRAHKSKFPLTLERTFLGLYTLVLGDAEEHNIDHLDKRVVAALSLQKSAHKECLQDWKGYKQGKSPQEVRSNSQKQGKERRRQRRSYLTEYSVGCQNNDQALCQLPSQILRVLRSLKNRMLLVARRNGLVHQRELRDQNKELCLKPNSQRRPLLQGKEQMQIRLSSSLSQKVCERFFLVLQGWFSWSWLTPYSFASG